MAVHSKSLGCSMLAAGMGRPSCPPRSWFHGFYWCCYCPWITPCRLPRLAHAQVLNLLAPIQADKGDRSGAEQMLTSSTTLAKVGAVCGRGLAAGRRAGCQKDASLLGAAPCCAGTAQLQW